MSESKFEQRSTDSFPWHIDKYISISYIFCRRAPAGRAGFAKESICRHLRLVTSHTAVTLLVVVLGLLAYHFVWARRLTHKKWQLEQLVPCELNSYELNHKITKSYSLHKLFSTMCTQKFRCFRTLCGQVHQGPALHFVIEYQIFFNQ